MRCPTWSAHYEIRVKGILDQRWTAWFEGLAIDSDHSQTIISGPMVDQAALHGPLNKVRDLGLVPVSGRRSVQGNRARRTSCIKPCCGGHRCLVPARFHQLALSCGLRRRP